MGDMHSCDFRLAADAAGLTAPRLAVDEVMRGRRSVRAFLPEPVSRETLEEILAVARFAPSGTNIQPWKVRVLAGEHKDRLCRAVLAAFNSPADDGDEEYSYYPAKWRSPYIERRREVGYGLYSLLGITREDKAGMHRQHGRNYLFFDAPVGLVFTIDRDMGQGSWLDYGMFLQNIMLAAKARGLDTCPQAAFNKYHRVITRELGIPDSEMLVCAMSLGYADTGAPENGLQPSRCTVEEFARFSGFE